MQRRREQRTALLDLLAMLGGSQAAVRRQGMLTDSDPDAGLFGPDSVTWRVVREPLLLLSGGRALLMQVAHPLVAQGVVDHSSFETQPFSRLLGTVRWVMQVVFGTTKEALAAIDSLHRLHEPVRGRLTAGNATARVAISTAYSALDRELGRWVHATLVESMLAGYQALVEPLPEAGADQFVCEWSTIARHLGVGPDPAWRTAADLHAYVDQQLATGLVSPVEASRSAGRTVLAPPFPWPGLQPVSRLLAFFTAGFLPSPLRPGYRIAWSSSEQRRFDACCSLLRAAHPYLPHRLRVSPLHEIAHARVAGRLSKLT